MTTKKATTARRSGKTAAQEAAQTPPDPLADLRDPDDTRYPPQEGPQGAQEAAGAPGETDPLSTLVFEALGAASACWEDLSSAGEFQSDAARAIGDDLVDALRPMLETQALDADEAVRRWHADTVALGFLHKGGRCGCAYIARVILGA